MDCDQAVPTVYHYYFTAANCRSAELMTEFIVYTKHHGKQVFDVVVARADERPAEIVLDVSAANGPEATAVRFTVRDYNKAQVDVGSIRLASMTKGENWSLDCRAGQVRFLPAGLPFRVTVGDFPVKWMVSGDLVVTPTGGGGTINKNIDIPWPLARKKPILTLDGVRPSLDTVWWCTVSGEFESHEREKGIRKYPRGVRNYPIRGGVLPEGHYPVGRINLRIQSLDRYWTKHVVIRPGGEGLEVPLRLEGAKEL